MSALGILLSEDTINAAITAKWASDGLDAGHEGLEVPDTSGEVVVDDEPEPASDTDVVDEPVDTADTGDDPAPVVDDEPVVEETPVVDTPVETPAEEKQHEEENELALALGLGKPPDDPKKRAQWWKSRLPFSQVHKEFTTQKKKWAETHESALKTHTDKIAGYDTRFADVAKVEKFIQESPAEYAKTLANMFPDSYGKLFAPILGSHDGKAAAALPAIEDLGEMPGPNLTLSDGSMTYNLEGLKARDEWVVKATEQRVLKTFKPHMDFLQEQKTAADKKQEADAAEAREKTWAQETKDAITEAQTWEKATENFEEITKVAAKLPANYNALTALSIAYNKVVMPKLKADRDSMRAEIQKELKAASAKKTAITIAAGQQTQRKAEKPDGGSLDDRILAAWARKGLKP